MNKDFMDIYAEFVSKLFKVDLPMGGKTHAVLGIAGEAGELVDAVKKSEVYGKELDVENVIEELGDLHFYMTALCNELNITMATAIRANMDKLSVRYPNLVYRDQDAIERKDKQ